jgi:hypothetical protein
MKKTLLTLATGLWTCSAALAWIPGMPLYYPLPGGTGVESNMFCILAGRSLHDVEPAARAKIIKAMQAENPALKLEPGSYQNPYWITPVTSFNYDNCTATL